MSEAQSTALAQPVEKLSYSQVPMDVAGAGGKLSFRHLGDVVAFAAVMSRAGVALPKHLRDNQGACLAICMQADRWEMDPFAVANKSYSVNDRMAYEAQLVAAVVNTRAPIQGRPEYEFTGQTGTTRRCTVRCKMSDGSVREYTSPEVSKITTKNSPLWKTDEDQQLGYLSVRSWARRHTPEVLLGVYTPDEVATFSDNILDVTPKAPPGLAARLASAKPGAEGFSASQAEETPKHDPATGEIEETDADATPAADAHFVDNAAALAEGEAEQPAAEPEAQAEPPPADDGFPGDRPSTQDQTPAATGPLLSERADAYEARLREATDGTKLASFQRAAQQLLRDLDARDPERKVELDALFEELAAKLEDERKAQAAAGTQ